jgi:hypothetical protein
MPFNSSDRPRNVPILDSGDGGQRGGGVDGGVGYVTCTFCMAKMKTEDQLLWREKGSCSGPPKDRIGKNRKENGQFPCGMGVWSCFPAEWGCRAVVDGRELVAKKDVSAPTSDGKTFDGRRRGGRVSKQR